MKKFSLIAVAVLTVLAGTLWNYRAEALTLITTRQAQTSGTPTNVPGTASNGSSDSFAKVDHVHDSSLSYLVNPGQPGGYPTPQTVGVSSRFSLYGLMGNDGGIDNGYWHTLFNLGYGADTVNQHQLLVSNVGHMWLRTAPRTAGSIWGRWKPMSGVAYLSEGLENGQSFPTYPLNVWKTPSDLTITDPLNYCASRNCTGTWGSITSSPISGGWSFGAYNGFNVNGVNTCNSMRAKVYVPKPAYFTFRYSYGTEACCDFAEFFQDGNRQIHLGGTGNNVYSSGLTVGWHEMVWRYCKDGSQDANGDFFKVDEVTISPYGEESASGWGLLGEPYITWATTSSDDRPRQLVAGTRTSINTATAGQIKVDVSDPLYARLTSGNSGGSTTSTSYVNVPDLNFAVLNGVSYSFDCKLLLRTSAAATGFGLAINGPSASLIHYTTEFPSSWALNNNSVYTFRVSSETYDAMTATTTGNNGSSTYFQAKIWGTLIPSANGTLSVRVKSEDGGNVYWYIGSYCTLARM